MTRAWTAVAWSVCAAALALLALALSIVYLGWSTPLPEGWIPWRGQAITCVGLAGAPVLGALIASRRPESPYGWLWLSFGLAFAVLFFAQVYAAYALVAQPGSLPAPRVFGTVVAGEGWTLGTVLVPFLFLLFPTGRLPSRRWRIVVWTVAVAGTTALIAGPFMPSEGNFVPAENPLAAGGVAGETITALVNGAVIIVLLAIVPSALSLVFRYRRAGGIERQQLKWFAYAAVLLVAEISVQFFYEPPGAWDALFEIFPFAGLYAAVGVAILRYRLYDIDVIINRTLVYGTLTLTLALAYYGGVVVLQSVFRVLAGQGSQLAVVASTLAIAALFGPLRRRIQTVIDRRFYRRKYNAAKTLEAFSARLRDEAELDVLMEDLVGMVRGTMQPMHVSLWLHPQNRAAGERVTR